MVPSNEGNNVWSMIQNVGDQIIRYQQAKNQAQAAPAGKPSNVLVNPFPGMFSTTPQSDTKVDHDGASAGIFGFNPLLVVAALLGVLLYMRLAR